jgi:hypothetical protein
VREEIAGAERAATAIQDKLDRLDEAFLFKRSIDIETYDRHAEKLRQELTLARIDRHSGQLEELDVEGILAFAERILPRASDLWVQASLEQRQRFQQLFFPNGIAFDGNRFVGTGATAPAFSYLRGIETGNEGLVGQTGIEPSTKGRSQRLITGEMSPTVEETEWQVGRKLCPRLCPNECLPSTNTITYGETPRNILPELSR